MQPKLANGTARKTEPATPVKKVAVQIGKTRKSLAVTVKRAEDPLHDLPHDGNHPPVKAAAKDTAVLALAVPDKESLPVPATFKTKRQKLVGKHLPVMNCNTCKFTDVCAMYKVGYECAFVGALFKGDISTKADLLAAMRNLVEANVTRSQIAVMQEQLAGGMMTEDTTVILDTTFRQLKDLHELEGAPDVPTPDKQGIVAAIFGGLIRAAKPVQTVTVADAPPQVIDAAYTEKTLETVHDRAAQPSGSDAHRPDGGVQPELAKPAQAGN